MAATKQVSRSGKGTSTTSPPAGATRPPPQLIWSVLEVVQSGVVKQDRLGVPTVRLMAMPLNGHLFGREVAAHIYGCNPFRYLALSALASQSELDAAMSRLTTVSRIRPEAARSAFIKTGYDGHLPGEEPLEQIERLQDPQQRILCEVFWPHYDPATLEIVRQDRHVVSRAAMQAQLQRSEDSDRRTAALAKHALAVSYHNLAIGFELAYATGHAGLSNGFWNKALRYWREVSADGEFWCWVHERVDALDDPRLRHEDIELLRAELPGLILGFHRVFAQAYARKGDVPACNRQLRMIAESGFPAAIRREALILAVRSVTATRLEPLLQWAEDPSHYHDGQFVGNGKQKDKWSRQEFVRLYGPILDRATELRHFLREDLKLSENLLALTEFDRLCEILTTAINTRIDYNNDDRLRSILYSILVNQRLLQLPVSESQRRQLEKGIREDTEILYRGWGQKTELPDPSRCWFLAGEPADPDESIELPVYKITEVRGISVRWETRPVLAPRSKLAAAVHRGEMSPDEAAAARKDKKSLRLRAEIDQLKSSSEVAARGIEAHYEQKVARRQAECQTRLEAYNAQAAPREQPDQALVQEIEDALAREVGTEEQRCQTECQRVRAERQAGIDQAQRQFSAQQRLYQGWSRILRIVLPAAAVALPMCLGVAAVVKASGLSALSGGWLVGAGLAAGVAVTWGASQIVYARVLANLRKPLKERERNRDRAIEAVQASSRMAAAQLEQAAAQKAAPARTRLREIESQRAAILQTAAAETDRFRREAKRRIRQLKQQDGKKIAALEQQLVAHLRLEPESAARDFPAYKTAKSQGFQDGAQPSQQELDRLVQREIDTFIRYLDDSEKNLLAQMQSSLPSSQFHELLAHLMALPRSELRGLMRRMRREMIGF